MNKIFLSVLLFFSFAGCSSKETVPIYDYYKNIPIIRGWTSDEDPRNYIIEVVLVYREKNSDLQTKINQLNPSLIDAMRGYFSSLRDEDFVLDNEENIKKKVVSILNDIILNSLSPKNAEKLRGETDLEKLDLILDINIMQLQVFHLD